MLDKLPNDFLIAVPTKNRAKYFKKYTYSWLKYLPNYKVFIEEQDILKYDYLDHTNTVVLKEQNQGLGYVKEEIKKYCEYMGIKTVFKLDDDVKGLVSKERGGSKKGEEAAKLATATILDCLRALENESVGAIGFPYRNEMYEVKKWVSFNSRVQSCYIIKVEELFADRRFSTFEDFVTYIHLRIHNKLVLRYGLMGLDMAPIGNLKGGLQDFDRNTMAINEINIIRNEIYPALKIKHVSDKQWKYEPDLKGGIFSLKNNKK